MFEFIHEYAWERLVATPELRVIVRKHALLFLSLAEDAELELQGPDQAAWRERLQRELPNFRAALRWSLDGGDLQHALRATAALWMFWFVRGHLTEGRRWLEALLHAAREDVAIAERSKALFTAGILAFYQRDYEAGRRFHDEALALQRHLGDRAGIADALFGLAQNAFGVGDLQTARRLHEEALATRRELADPWKIALSCGNLGLVLQAQRDNAQARQLIEECLAIRRALGDRRGIGAVLVILGRLVQAYGEYKHARELYGEAFDIVRELDESWSLTHLLASVAGLMAALRQWQLAWKIGGAAAEASRTSGNGLFPGWLEELNEVLARARRELGPSANDRTPEDDGAINELLSKALAIQPTKTFDDAPLGTHAAVAVPLTRREREVAALVARGFSNREIAMALTITSRTAAAHVEHILRKLNLTSRTQIALWASTHALGSLAGSRKLAGF